MALFLKHAPCGAGAGEHHASAGDLGAGHQPEMHTDAENGDIRKSCVYIPYISFKAWADRAGI